ncbi:zinc metalloprotease [Peribacillus sp. NPDC096447]|uniref:zinc metalloprotease n=1 Tax=Peribacillus sp. NPDC096447 TaxID=3364394 RepID=UPI00380F2DC9
MTRSCGTMDYHNWLLSQSEAYAEERMKIEKFSNDYIMGNHMISNRNVITIPIVVHIVHQTPNIVTDAQINSQIDVLNLDFRGRNSDLGKVPSHWIGITGDARIEFVLSEITRTITTVSSFSKTNLNDVKSATTGGANPRPSNQFLNIWLCELTGILGIATLPGGAPELDGSVIRHSAFGTTGSARAPFNLGRTATHEIGHWLNLYHIWGKHDSKIALCEDTDFVDDTPTQEMANYNPPPSGTHITCSNGPHGDMYMNFMDYTADKDMYMFTQGQVARMDACLKGPRSSFLVYQDPTFAGAVSGSSMFIQSNVGTKGNFELVVPLSTGDITYFCRNNDNASSNWTSSDINVPNTYKFISTKLIQSNYSGNFEVIALDDRGHISYITRYSETKKWSNISLLELYDTNNVKLTFNGHPAFIQSRFGTKGNFELVAPLSRNGLAHFWRDNDNPKLSWSKGTIFATELGEVDAVGLIQSNYGTPGNLEVVVLHDTRRKLAHMSRDSNTGIWSKPLALEFCEPSNPKLFFRGNPAFLQSQYGTKGNFELIIPLASGGLVHFSRNNDELNPCWSKGTIFATELGEVDAVGLIQSNYGTPGNLEVVALCDNETQLAHIFRDSNTGIWNDDYTIIKS